MANGHGASGHGGAAVATAPRAQGISGGKGSGGKGSAPATSAPTSAPTVVSGPTVGGVVPSLAAVQGAQAGDPGSAGEQSAAATGKAKKGRFGQVLVGIGDKHKPTYESLTTLAKKLQCRISALMWLGAEKLLADPPTEAPAGAVAHVGTASGYWVIPIKDQTGRAVDAKVAEVAERGQVVGGAQFFYYAAGNDKQRARARKQAITQATTVRGWLNPDLTGDPEVMDLAGIVPATDTAPASA